PFDDDDVWDPPGTTGPTRILKLFQPSHDRYYAVTVEVFCDLPGLPRAVGHTELELGMVVRRSTASATIEVWVRDRWRPLADLGTPGVGPEREYPMWRLPAGAGDGTPRSTWFGVMPTSSTELDRDGLPRFDENSVYQVSCFVRVPRQGCPPLVFP